MPDITVALSGGVDSAVSAAILKENGWRVRALFLKNWDDADGTDECTFEDDFNSARAVADCLDIELDLQTLSAEYYESVFEPMVIAYKQGLTPNPDILCNEKVKFGALPKLIEDAGGNILATGHYASSELPIDAERAQDYFNHSKVMQDENSSQVVTALPFSLRCAKDTFKDQTYFLSSSPPSSLSKTIFPIHNLTRKQVVDKAHALSLPCADRPGTVGVCFISPKKFQTFLARYIKEKPGYIVDTLGKVIGEHKGAHFFTRGQRKGLGIGGIKGYDQAPWYVVTTNIATNLVIVAQESLTKTAEDNPHQSLGKDDPTSALNSLYSAWVDITPLAWANSHSSPDAFKDWAETKFNTSHLVYRLRHQGELVRGVIKPSPNTPKWRIHFEQPQLGIAPGQQCVIYCHQKDLQSFDEALSNIPDTPASNLHCLGGSPIVKTQTDEILQ